MVTEQQGKIAVVTGAGRNIGRQVALTLADEGWKVAVVDIDLDSAQSVADEVEAHGGQAGAFTCDVMDEGSVRELSVEVRKRLGVAQGLVNNVGITANNTLLDTSLDEWNRTLAGCLTCSFLMIREFVPPMLEAGLRGAIVNVGSTSAHRGNRGKVAYGVAKSGVLNLTRMAAVEFADQGIRVNTVSPALTGSPVGFDDSAQRTGPAANVPLGRWGRPIDQAEAIAFLLSDRAEFITGTELVVDGGVLARYPK